VPTERKGTAGADRVAIITGGSVGVGGAISRKLAGQGYAVSISYLGNLFAAETTVEEILSSRGVALAVRADLADDLDVERLFAETEAAFVGVDVVVHAAALTPETDSEVEVASRRLRLRAARVVSREAARHLRDGGALINLCRAADLAGTRAVETLTRALSHELRLRDLTVNAVACRFEDPDRWAGVVDLVASLAGERGSSVDGRLLRIDEPGLSPGITPGATDHGRRDGQETSNGGDHEHD
jgi:NAD(P)-dependent dehydrogenase (short-subunit alcohol dehydrogenase family)